jgi:hypothetical protein
VYVLLYAAMIVFFCFFYTALVFNSRETADNLKKSGAFIPGIRPGEQTAKHIDKILSRLTLAARSTSPPCACCRSSWCSSTTCRSISGAPRS